MRNIPTEEIMRQRIEALRHDHERRVQREAIIRAHDEITVNIARSYLGRSPLSDFISRTDLIRNTANTHLNSNANTDTEDNKMTAKDVDSKVKDTVDEKDLKKIYTNFNYKLEPEGSHIKVKLKFSNGRNVCFYHKALEGNCGVSFIFKPTMYGTDDYKLLIQDYQTWNGVIKASILEEEEKWIYRAILKILMRHVGEDRKVLFFTDAEGSENPHKISLYRMAKLFGLDKSKMVVNSNSGHHIFSSWNDKREVEKKYLSGYRWNIKRVY